MNLSGRDSFYRNGTKYVKAEQSLYSPYQQVDFSSCFRMLTAFRLAYRLRRNCYVKKSNSLLKKHCNLSITYSISAYVSIKKNMQSMFLLFLIFLVFYTKLFLHIYFIYPFVAVYCYKKFKVTIFRNFF